MNSITESFKIASETKQKSPVPKDIIPVETSIQRDDECHNGWLYF